jgi:hypothetical protein
MVTRRSSAQEVPEIEVYNRELATLTDLDPETLDPDYIYRWVHKSGLKIGRQKARGYVIVKPEDEEVKNAAGEAPEAADGTYTIGDVVLMKIRKLEHRQRKHAQKRKTDKRLKGPVRKFRRDARSKTDRAGQRVEVITTKDPQGKED